MSGSFVLAGVGFGWGLNAITEVARRNREAKKDPNGLRRELAVRFLEATERAWVWSNNFANMTLTDRTGAGLTVESASRYGEAMAKLAQADRDVRSLDIEIQLVGNDAESRPAHRLREASWAMGAADAVYPTSLETGRKKQRRREFAENSREYNDAREAFLTVARKGLLAP